MFVCVVGVVVFFWSEVVGLAGFCVVGGLLCCCVCFLSVLDVSVVGCC